MHERGWCSVVPSHAQTFLDPTFAPSPPYRSRAQHAQHPTSPARARCQAGCSSPGTQLACMLSHTLACIPRIPDMVQDTLSSAPSLPKPKPQPAQEPALLLTADNSLCSLIATCKPPRTNQRLRSPGSPDRSVSATGRNDIMRSAAWSELVLRDWDGPPRILKATDIVLAGRS